MLNPLQNNTEVPIQKEKRIYFESLPLQEKRVIQIKCRITQNFSAKTAINFEMENSENKSRPAKCYHLSLD